MWSVLSLLNADNIVGFIAGFAFGVSCGFFLARVLKAQYERRYRRCDEIRHTQKPHYYTLTLKNGKYYKLFCSNLKKDKKTCTILNAHCPLVED